MEIIEGDCLEVMRGFEVNSFDLVLTDPPYGINADKGVGGFGASNTDRHYTDDWDSNTPSKEYFDEMLRVGKSVIVFGGQFFTDKLPPNGHWIVWDKKGSIEFDNPFGDCELAWTNLPRKSVKKYTVIQQGFVSQEKVRWHPTQKPVELFSLILRDYTQENDFGQPARILDPFMGSGTALVAAQSLGIDSVGIEINPVYCKVAQSRLEQKQLL